MISKKGHVTAISGDKTIKVEVHDYRPHPKYKKQYRITKRFLVHDPEGQGKVGDYVTIQQLGKKLSRRKSFILKSVITPAAAA